MLRLRFPKKVVRFGLLFSEGRKVVFEVAKMRMRVTYHNGRANKQGVYSTKHNDRNFEIENASHIAPEQTENNAYWHIYQHQNPEMSFENAEEKFYREHFGDFLKTRNNRYLAQRQKKRVQSMTDYRKSQKSCPEETIMQIGNINQKISKEKMCRIFNAYINWQNKQYPQLATLNCAYHGDEQGAGHIHIRQVWIAHDSEGREMVHQGQSLAEMGVQRPKPEKKESRYNNAKMVFTKKSREKIIEIARSFGVEIEDKAQDASKSGKDLLAWQVERDKVKLEEAKAELQNIQAERKEIFAEIAKAEMYFAEISEGTEAEKKRAMENKALADAETKRLADLRVVDAERQRQHEVELQNLKEKADKEEMRAKKNKALADAEETRLVEIWAADAERQRLFEIEENARQQQKKEAEQYLENTKKKANEAEAWLKKANQQADILTQKKEKIDSDISQLRIYQQQVENDVENSECELKLLKLQTEEAIENKGKSVRIISQIAEPILEVSEAIQSKNKNKLWIAVQGLVKAFVAIAEHIPFFKVMRENRELIENQQFDGAYKNLCGAEPELTAEERGLKFLRSVVRVHGINNYNIISNAIQAVADNENKDTAFELKLSQMLRQTDEYKGMAGTISKAQHFDCNRPKTLQIID